MDRGGLVGADGPTHHGVFDISYLRMIPNLALMAPRDEDQLRHMLLTAIQSGVPVGLRYPRGTGAGVKLDEPPRELPWGKGEVLHSDGDDLLLLAAGPHVYTALSAAQELTARHIACTVIDARFLKPLDEDLLAEHIGRAASVITVEENALAGGFGSAVLEMCERHGLRPNLRRIGIADTFVTHGRTDELQAACGISVDGILRAYDEVAPATRIYAFGRRLEA